MLWNSVFWFITIFFCGLFQVVVVLGINLMEPSNKVTFEQLIMDGPLLFVSATIVSSLPIDYYLSQGVSHMNKNIRFLFFLFPGIIIFACVLIFTFCYGKSPQEVEFENIVYIHLGIFIVAFLYSIIVKLDTFRTLQQINDRLSSFKLIIKYKRYRVFLYSLNNRKGDHR